MTQEERTDENVGPLTLAALVSASEAVAATRSRAAKVDLMADVLRRARPGEVELAATYLGGAIRQRRTGIGWRSLGDRPAPAASATLSLAEVDATLERLAGMEGPGSRAERAAGLAALLGRATDAEQRHLARLLTGELRQGALAGVLTDAVSRAWDVPADDVRRAAMLAGSVPAVAAAVASGGAEALAGWTVEVFTPVSPMLASSAGSVAAALASVSPGSPVAIEAKLDGLRVQVHKRGDEVRVYSRSLDDWTDRLPGVVAAARTIDAEVAVVDGEALALDADGRPRLFQDTASGADGEVVPFFFDALVLDEPVLDLPLARRAALLAERVPVRHMIQGTVTDQVALAEAFTEHVLAQGHEGVVVKDLSAPYTAGRRGSAWVKVKPVHTLDLVVLAVEWGSGRRQGWLSNVHLGARDPDGGGFVMLGKTFKGMTDEMLRWQTERFLALETHREGGVVHVRPEQVVEVAFDGLQRSSRYPGGVALRFARVVRYREDKPASGADTLAAVRALAR